MAAAARPGDITWHEFPTVFPESDGNFTGNVSQSANSFEDTDYDMTDAYQDWSHVFDGYNDYFFSQNMTGEDESDGDYFWVFLPDVIPKPIRVFVVLAFVVIITMAVVGNVLVIFVVAKHNKMRTVTNVFLVSLAVSDLMIATVNMPIQLVWYLKNEWTMGEPLCKFSNYLQGVVIVASILTLTGIALDRYYAICHPLRARHLHTLNRSFILICVFWCLAFLLVLPQIFIQRLEPQLVVVAASNDSELGSMRSVWVCAEHFSSYRWEVVYVLYTYTLLYVCPVLVLFVTYGRIAFKLWKRQPIGETPTTNPGDQCRRQQQTKRVVRMLVVIVALFVIAWFPFFTCHVYAVFQQNTAGEVYDTVEFRIALAMSHLAGYSNSCINPLVYCFMNDGFRKHFYQSVCYACRDCRHRGKRRRSCTTEMNGLTPIVSTNLTNNSTV